MFSKFFIQTALAFSAMCGLSCTLAAETVTCSFYSQSYNGRRTANGQIFNNNKLTAASKTLPFGTRVKLTNEANGRSVIVRVNDRGPFAPGRDISVTRRAAQRLHMIRAGVVKVELENLSGSTSPSTSAKPVK